MCVCVCVFVCVCVCVCVCVGGWVGGWVGVGVFVCYNWSLESNSVTKLLGGFTKP